MYVRVRINLVASLCPIAVDLVASPDAVVASRGRLRLHAEYYIRKQIVPALERVLSLVGADVKAWAAAVPRNLRLQPQKRPVGALAVPEVRVPQRYLDVACVWRSKAPCLDNGLALSGAFSISGKYTVECPVSIWGKYPV